MYVCMYLYVQLNHGISFSLNVIRYNEGMAVWMEVNIHAMYLFVRKAFLTPLLETHSRPVFCFVSAYINIS